MYSGGNITSLSGRTSWSTAAVAARVWAAHDEAAGGEVAADVHSSFQGGEPFVEPVCFHTIFNPLKRVIFFLDLSGDGASFDFKLGAALVVTTISLHLCVGGGVLEGACRFSQGVVGSSPGLEEFNEPVW